MYWHVDCRQVSKLILFAESDKGKLLRKGRTQSHRPKVFWEDKGGGTAEEVGIPQKPVPFGWAFLVGGNGYESYAKS